MEEATPVVSEQVRRLMGERIPTMDDAKMITLAIKKVERFWRLEVSANCVPMTNHRCTPEFCKERDTMPYVIYATSLRGKPSQLNPDISFVDVGDNFQHYHVCMPRHCAFKEMRELHHKEILSNSDVSFCRSTGTIHVCSPTCGQQSNTLSTGTYEYVCYLTGRICGSFMLESYSLPDAPAVSYEKSDTDAHTLTYSNASGNITQNTSHSSGYGTPETRLRQMFSIVLTAKDAHDIMNGLEMLKQRKHYPRREAYFLAAIAKIGILFTPTRLRGVEAKNSQTQFELVKHLKDSIQLYNAPGSTLRPLSVVEQFEMIENCTLRAQMVPRTDIAVAVKELLIRQWALKCVRLWYIVRSRTTYGRERPELYKFWQFIDAALSILSNGLIVRGDVTAHGASIELVPSDWILLLYHRHDNAIDMGAREPTSRPQNTSTTMKQSIVEAFFNTYVETKDEQSLRLDSVRLLEECDEAHFIDLQLPSVRATPTAKAKRGTKATEVKPPKRLKPNVVVPRRVRTEKTND